MPNLADKNRLTALHLAVSRNYEDTVKNLLQCKNINVNTRATCGTPTQTAVENNNLN